jgi:hypothetical protein
MRTTLLITMIAFVLAACTSATAPASHDCNPPGTTTGSGQC